MASLVNNLGGAVGFGENYISRNDDYYTNGVSLTSLFGTQGLNFFGTNYTYVAINNNGNVTLSNSTYGGLGTFTPFALANGGYAIIAPFFADVDTRLSTGGSVAANQVTPTAGGTSRGSDLVWYDLNTSGYGTLTVTWDDVGYFSSKTDKLNAFQLQIVGTDNSGNFDVIFRYETINWTTGSASGGTNGFGGTVARAGYSTGDGASWYELAQSGLQDSMLALESTPGNTGVAGYYKFSVRSGTAAGDVMNGTNADDLLAGAGGNDTINGFAGNDYLIGNAGSDRLLGGAGNDTYTTDGTDTIVELANAGTDLVMSSVSYTAGANLEDISLTGSSYINATGNALANVLAGNSGNNTLNGMGGSDTVDYSMATYGITVNLGLTSSQYISSQGSDTLLSIENVIGSLYNDNLTGTSSANVINGNLGNDTMVGGDGSDIYFVDSTYDVVTETNAFALSGGTDAVQSYLSAYTLGSNVENGRILSVGTASLTGNTLGNVLVAGRGNNILNGSTGNDTADYRYAASGVTLNLGLSTYQVTGGSGSDKLVYIENLAGSSFADRLTGNAVANKLSGLAGNDVLSGAGGNDILTGGAGNDVFLFNTLPNASANKDTITDFGRVTGNNDMIYLDDDVFTALGTVTVTTALAASKFVANAAGVATSTSQRIVYDTDSGALYYDSNGSVAGGQVQFATLTGHPTLTVADFFVVA